MIFRRPVIWFFAVSCALLGVSTHASYVIDAEGSGINRGAISKGAGFDFVTHDFGLESKDAIQIALTNLQRAPNLHGNLLGRLPDVAVVVSEDAVPPDAAAPAATAVSVELVVLENQEDFAYYDQVAPDGDSEENGLDAYVAGDEPLLSANPRELPLIIAPTLFWVLKPAEFESFSQMMAARFGF